jgi:integrase
MKLTAAKIRSLALPAGRTEAIFWDDDIGGFGVRLREGGSRNFVFQYKLGDKQRRMALGSVAAVDFGEMRKTAEKLYARVKLGHDPQGEKTHARVKAAETFEAVAALYLARQRVALRPRSYPDVERHLLVHAKPLHQLQLARIARRDVAMVTAAVTNNAGKVTGNRVRTSLSAFFNWCLGEGLAENNPVVGTNRNEERPRDRVLTAEELRAIWNAFANDHYGSIVKLLALTGARANEIAALRWSEIRDGMIQLPGERTKNHRPHTIPLSQAARSIIDAQPRRTNGDGKLRDFVFGLAAGPFSGWSNCKERLDQRIEETAGKIPDWRIHDLRRAAATGMAESCGIQPHIIEAVLNHVSGHKGGVAGIYNLASYEVEKRTALNRWAEHLLAVVAGRGSNIATLKRA